MSEQLSTSLLSKMRDAPAPPMQMLRIMNDELAVSCVPKRLVPFRANELMCEMKRVLENVATHCAT